LDQNHLRAKEEDLIHSGGKGAAFEEVTSITHAGTYVDAAWHYSSQSEGNPARKIDELPIEWFFSDGVVLNLKHKKPGEKISKRRCSVSVTCSSLSIS
jgi:kynurenine formamidase